MPNYDDPQEIRQAVTGSTYAFGGFDGAVSVGHHVGSAKMPPRDKSEARIPSQLDFMSEQLDLLTRLVYELREKLNPILIPEEDNINKPGSEPMPAYTSPISDQLDSLNRHIIRQQVIIDNMTQAVQL